MKKYREIVNVNVKCIYIALLHNKHKLVDVLYNKKKESVQSKLPLTFHHGEWKQNVLKSVFIEEKSDFSVMLFQVASVAIEGGHGVIGGYNCI